MIVIIGAGISGLSLGHELLKRGAEVAIIDRHGIASGASGVATCYMEPRLGDTPMRRLEREALRRWPEFVSEIGHADALGFNESGQIRVALTENVEKLADNTRLRQEEGSPVGSLSPERARALEPFLSDDIAASVFLPHVRWADGRAVCAALASKIESEGGRIRTDLGVEQIDQNRLRLSDGTSVEAQSIVLCNGMGANALDGRPEDIPRARAVRGVNLVLDMGGLERPVRHMIKHHRGNMVPNGNRLIVGTTYEAGEESLEVSDEIIERLYAHAEPILPRIREFPLIEINAGLRTKVGDGHLRLGRSRDNPAIFYSLGHAGSGYLRAPVVAPGFAHFVLTGDLDEHLTGIIEP